MWSKIRDEIVGDGKPRVSGHIAYRAVLKRAEVPDGALAARTSCCGPDRGPISCIIRCGAASSTIWSPCFIPTAMSKAGTPRPTPTISVAHFKGQRPEVLRMLERIETWRMWVLCDREPVKDWAKGRVALLGDAAHPMLQYLAQGACMATEDAVCLADNIAATARTICRQRFKAYEQQRYLRTGAGADHGAGLRRVLSRARRHRRNCATRCSAAATPSRPMTGWRGSTVNQASGAGAYRRISSSGRLPAPVIIAAAARRSRALRRSHRGCAAPC